ncbi:hypothetical protein HMPREF0495_00949 [Levilactobacillus brevis ATCC 14869 = DSM 20054]|uniref:Uncharacterized protein n=1 Tax=Levilactobacillus brevis ATCC 14869 = DSM 20054 TaxID=649758 RepID=U2PJR7_LEVBR|nr:hypothetical protein HMPREF0495_00949 [Levilactobacillus brevis ATCC 14869 = DSM 20054]
MERRSLANGSGFLFIVIIMKFSHFNFSLIKIELLKNVYTVALHI